MTLVWRSSINDHHLTVNGGPTNDGQMTVIDERHMNVMANDGPMIVIGDDQMTVNANDRHMTVYDRHW